MSLTASPSSQRIAQTIDNIRITEEEFKVKVDECNALRLKLNEVQQDLERTQMLLRRQENTTASQAEALIKAQHSLDIVLKELQLKKQSVESLQAENSRLKRDLEASQKHAGDAVKTLQSKSVAKDIGGMKDTPESLYVQQCFRSGCDPHTDIVRGLHQGLSIEAVKRPVTFQQLNALLEVMEMKRTLDPLDASGPGLQKISIAVDTQESLLMVGQLIRDIKTVRDVELYGVGNLVASDLAAALAVSDHVRTLSLPQLSVTDDGFQALMKIINNREQLYLLENEKFMKNVSEAHAAKNEALVQFLQAEGPKVKLLSIAELDLTHSLLSEPRSFELIRGLAISSLNLRNCSELHDNHIGEILRGCPQLQSLTLSGCSQLTNDTVSFINTARSLTRVNALHCPGMSKLVFFHVEVLETDLTGVSHLECLKLTTLPVPIVHFRLVSFACPVLETITFKGLAFSNRELEMVSDSSPELKRLSFIKCRLASADYFLRMMRMLTHLSVHACKGITDTEICCVGSRLTSIDLTENYCLTDRSMKYLSEVCKEMTHLTLKRCSNITDQGITCFSQHSALEFLNVLGTKKVTIVALHRLITSLPAIKRVIHESLVCSNVQVDRDDVEEAEKATIAQEQAVLLTKRDTAALNYVASESSPPRTQTLVGGGSDASSSLVKTPRPPSSSDASSPSARRARTASNEINGAAAAAAVPAAPVEGEALQQDDLAVGAMTTPL